MSDPSPAPGAPAPAFSRSRARLAHAVVVARGVETRYTRLGCGTPVVMLRAARADVEHDDWVLRLGERFRVLVPVLPAAVDPQVEQQFAVWLRDLLDGIGVERAHLVAEPALAGPVAAFARSDGLRVHRVAVREVGTSCDDVVRSLSEGARAAD
jgi:hypothetical protein